MSEKLTKDDAVNVVAWAYNGPRGGLIAVETKPAHAPEARALVDLADLAAAQGRISELEAEVGRLNRVATDRRYMMDAYWTMLGPNALAVVAAWKGRNVQRVHHSWGPDAAAMTGEERAAALLDWMAAEKTAVLITDVDSALSEQSP